MVIIELLDGEDEICISASKEATDGIYVSASRFAEEHDISERQIRVWKHRNQIEAITLFGRIFVKKSANPETARFKKGQKLKRRVSIF